MSTRKKVLIGLSTFLPFLLLVVIFGKLIMFAVQNPEGEPPLDLIIGFIGVYVLNYYYFYDKYNRICGPHGQKP